MTLTHTTDAELSAKRAANLLSQQTLERRPKSTAVAKTLRMLKAEMALIVGEQNRREATVEKFDAQFPVPELNGGA